MRKTLYRYSAVVLAMGTTLLAHAQQQTFTWQQLRERFLANNPTLLAGRLSVNEAKADEITAFLRPNPNLSFTADGTQIAPTNGVWQPLTGTFESAEINYLHERRHKRELRLESAKEGTLISESSFADAQRTLLFDLRSAYLSTLQAKAVQQLAKDNLGYYDHLLDVSRERFKAGDIAQIDFDRLELQRVQYESDWQAAEMNLRTAKIQLQQLLDDRTPVDQFDVQGAFEFSDGLPPLESFRQSAFDHRPDLQAALQSIEQAKTEYKLAVANGSTDPTFAAWHTYNSSTNNSNANQTIGLNISIPLRIFDRNQGEKNRTYLDIGRNQQLEDATRAQVFADVDSAYAQVNSNLILLRPYKEKYLDQALRVRETVTFAWQHGAASLMDFLNAQSEYRQVQLSYVQLIGAYLTATGQLNLAVGTEAIP